MKNIKLNKPDVIYNYLEKSKYRAMVILPSQILSIISILLLFAHATSDFNLVSLSFSIWLLFGSIVLLLLSMLLILWSDNKRKNKK